MNTPMFRVGRRWRSAVGLFLLAGLIAAPAFAAEEAASPKPAAAATGKPSEEEMMKQMMELSKLNENHKVLADLVGNWDYVVKWWMDPAAKASESKGTAERKSIMDGRYFTLDVAGKFEMPGPDGKMMAVDFQGKGTEGYDNAKKKFVSTWIDNMITGILYAEGTYDPASKTFTYTGETEMMPGMKTKIRETVKVVDKDHHVFEYFENRDGKEVKTMEIAYTRKK